MFYNTKKEITCELRSRHFLGSNVSAFTHHMTNLDSNIMVSNRGGAKKAMVATTGLVVTQTAHVSHTMRLYMDCL
jgi:hypothetical protein